MTVDLSVLICSTHTRHDTFGRSIQEQVWGQYAALPVADQARIEILMLTDNKRMVLGHKRNAMVSIAQGRYVQFIDDDDRIEPDMFKSVLDATASDADAITFQVSVSLNGAAPKVARYSKAFQADRNTRTEYQRIPNHICAVKRELARKAQFPVLTCGEDSEYAKRLLPMLKTEHAIDRVLYHYDYFSDSTETQRTPKRTADAPVVDVVILSKAKNDELYRMTQNAIDTCISGARPSRVNVVVMEQSGRVYRRATTVQVPGPVNLNRFANSAFRMGDAQWVMFANNDITFHSNWLRYLLAADYPVVSPKNPIDHRQAHITRNTRGYRNAVHFSGWCFMLKRELWERIGGFDEDVTFWCSDDVVIEQLKAINVEPMLVPAAKVTHRASVTLKIDPAHDELTWGQVDVFNRKYGQDKFSSDARYAVWKAARL